MRESTGSTPELRREVVLRQRGSASGFPCPDHADPGSVSAGGTRETSGILSCGSPDGQSAFTEVVAPEFQFLAVLATTLFTGAAIYINDAEHPARMECGTAVAAAVFGPSYRRAALMQAALALTRLSQFAGVFGHFRASTASKSFGSNDRLPETVAVKTYPLSS